MEKITVLVGMKDVSAAYEFMQVVSCSLMQRGYDSTIALGDNYDRMVLDTKHVRVGFIYNLSIQCLNGVYADAIFGQEPYKAQLARFLTKDSPYDVGMGLVDYIVYIERRFRAGIEYIKATRYGRFTECKEIRPMTNRYRDYFELIGTIHPRGGIMRTTVKQQPSIPEIKDVVFNDPATIVLWADGTKTVVRCQNGDSYDPEKGLAMAVSKKVLGNKHDYYHTFKHWLKKYEKKG